MRRAPISESGEGRDEPLTWGAPYQRTNLQPGFINDNDAGRPALARDQRSDPPGLSALQDVLTPEPIGVIPAASNQTGAGMPPSNGAAAIRALFNAVKEILSLSGEDAPQPVRRRRGETDKGFTDKGFIAACRAVLRRAPKPEASSMGSHLTFVDVCAEAGVFLSDTLDPLNQWQGNVAQDTADYDHWHEDEFSATNWDNFPQP